ncbi:hypothetical protein HDU83_003642 [Entophlyctis luteolus]|nr:hypothetical protein HDU83_003642 [Entophlyctis luteolus]KAJ3391293.1 hypothetical protein HDU84_006209 [Entophlyctis sp. JEL0112]
MDLVLKRIIPQQTEDITVHWARRTLVAITIASILSIGCESWIIINERYSSSQLFDALASTNVATDSVDQVSSDLRVEVTYHSVFLGSLVFWLGITWDALLHQNLMQIVSINMYNVGLLVYASTQIAQTKMDTDSVASALPPNLSDNSSSGLFLAAQIVLPVIIGLFIPVFAYLSYRLHFEFGWRQYRITGGDLELRRIFFRYDILLLLLKFAIFFVVAFTVLDLVLTAVTSNGLIVIPILGAIVGAMVTTAGYYGARRENRLYIVIYITGCLVVLAYLVDRMYDAFRRKANADDFSRVEIPFMLYGSISFCLVLTSVFFGVVCWLNFGKGLREVLDDEAKKKSGYAFQAEVIDLEN